ncbi:MAG: ABC transporter permease [Spiroplasma sp.]|nr:ABC transporter permease [Spiroplasma sp.]
MPIFRYTTKKIFISPSTWVILILSILILGLSWGLPFLIINAESKIVIPWTKDLVLSLFLSSWKMFAFSGFISFMLIVFIGVKATQIFRDEIEDGTLLILVSKPISRNRIWLEKWLSFQFTLILYVFITILFGGLFLIIPKIGNSTIYLTFLPYMGLLFGIALLFDLIISSIVLLLSLVLNSKATIAISIGFAALINIFSQTLEFLIVIPGSYFSVSQAVAVFHDLERKVDGSDIDWIKTQLVRTSDAYEKDITDILTKVYQQDIPDVPSYPESFDPIKEQEVLNKIKNHQITKNYSTEEVNLITHIVNISNVFRQWQTQSYSVLMTHFSVGGVFPSDRANYSFFDVHKELNYNFSQQEIEEINTKVFQKQMLRYFNIFYHFYYLWTGAWGDNNSLYVSDYQSQNDPYLISFKEVDAGEPVKKYQVDLNSGKNKILNFPVLLGVYLVIGLGLLTTSWYIFNRRDFT